MMADRQDNSALFDNAGYYRCEMVEIISFTYFWWDKSPTSSLYRNPGLLHTTAVRLSDPPLCIQRTTSH